MVAGKLSPDPFQEGAKHLGPYVLMGSIPENWTKKAFQTEGTSQGSSLEWYRNSMSGIRMITNLEAENNIKCYRLTEGL